MLASKPARLITESQAPSQRRAATNIADEGSLETYAKLIDQLAQSKGWNTDWRWLTTGLFAESGELVNKIVHGAPDYLIADEFADVMHYLLQLVKPFCNTVDLDKALYGKIEANYSNKKKTTDKYGNVVRK